MKLSQYVAMLKTAKNAAYSEVTGVYHKLQRVGEFNGRVRTYQALEDNPTDTRPDEVEVVQTRAPELLAEAATVLGRQFDNQANVDYGNVIAKADVVVDGVTILKDAPVPYLLFMEKQIKDWIAVIRKLPLLDPAKEWNWSEDQELFFTVPTVTNATRRQPQSKVVVQATDKFPAQVRDWDEDVVVGHWRTTYKSGAMHRKDIRRLLARAERLAEAVKVAREEANSTPVNSKRGTGQVVFDYLLGGTDA